MNYDLPGSGPWARYFSGPEPKNLPPTGAAPRKTDADIQEEQRQARLGRERKRGRRATYLTNDNNPLGATTSGSLTDPGSGSTIG